jgi:hypothetical protein
MSQDDIVPPSFETPGEATGTNVSSAWSRPTQIQLDRLKDGEEVAIKVKGVLRKAKWNASRRKLEFEDVSSSGPMGLSTLIYGATGNLGNTLENKPYSESLGDALFGMMPEKNAIEGAKQISRGKLNPTSALPLFPITASRQMEVDPSSIDAFGRGQSQLEHAGNYIVKDLPADLAALQTFMLAANSPLLKASPWWVKFPAASLASGVTHAGIDLFKEQTGILSRTEQDQINAVVNPGTQATMGHAGTAIAFRPDLNLIGTALGREARRMTQREAIAEMGNMGVANLGIVQAGGLSNAALHGTGAPTDSPVADRGVALLRSLGLGDPSQEWGGAPGDRVGTIAKEFAFGAGVLHKPFALGAKMHNIAHSDPAQKVKLSGAPTWEAMRSKVLDNQAGGLAAVNEIIQEQRARAARGDATNEDPAPPVLTTPLSPQAQHGVHQIKTALRRALDNKNITQEEHDTAQAVSDTLGDQVLRNIRLRQIGGTKGNVLGDSSEDADSNGLATSVTVFARALKTNRFNSTFVHEVFHPIFESLHPDLKNAINKELIQARIDARSKNKGLDEYLKKLGIGNEERWDFRLLSMKEGAAMVQHLKSVGVKNAESLFDSARIKNGTGYVLSRDAASDGGKREGLYRRVYSLQNAREFATDEAARAVARRGKYDARWGDAGKNWAVVNLARRIQAWLGTTVDGYHRNNSKTANEILDHIANKAIDKITESRDSVVPGKLMGDEAAKNTNRQLYGSESEPRSNEETQAAAIGDLLKSFSATHEGRVFEAREEISAREQKSKLDEELDLQNRRRNTANLGGESQATETAKPESESDPASGRLSEADADPSMPETSKEALKKLGIKNTVIGNVVRHSKIGSIRSEFDKASTAGEVAHIFRNTSQATQESIQVLVTDKDGNPLEIYRHTMSEPGSSTLLPSVMISQALSVKGAKKVWVSHNHPSMTPQFSGSDMSTEMNIKTMFKGTGLTLEGFLAIAGDKYAFVGKESKGRDLDRQVIPGSRFPATGREIPIIERRFTLPRGEDTDVVSTTKGDTDVNQRMLVKELLGGKPGVIFLDRNDRAVGHQEVTAEQMAKLGTAGARNLLAGFSRSGGTSIVVHVGGDTVADALQIQAGENVANLGASVRGFGKSFIKNIIGTNPLVRTLDSRGSRVSGFKSEGDAPAFDRGEPETRVGVGNIKPLHAAPNSNFPIMADKLKDFGFESGYLNQFSEHAIVGQLKTGVTQVRTAGDVASLIHDYSSTLAQGQTMILIIGADGKPIQVGLHMVDSSMNVEDKTVIKPMWGVLAGQAVSTPGAKEAWMVRINNDVVRGEVDASVENELALKNLLEGSGIDYRGLVAVAGRQYRSIEYSVGVQNKNGGHNQFDSTNVDWMPINVRPATSTIPLTERRYSTRSQIPYDAGETAPDRPIGAEDAGWNRSENASAKRLKEHLGGDPGVVFKTSSGKIVGTVHMTLDEMANIRNSPAQKTLLAMMDRAGVNWGMVSVGDAPNDPAAARATSNINAFLKQMGLKVTDTFHNDLGIVPGDPVGTSEYRWQSEGDAEAPLHRRDLRKDTPEWRQAEQDTEGTGVIEADKYGNPLPSDERGFLRVKPLTGVSSDKGDEGAYGRSVPTPLEKFESDLKSSKGIFTDQEKDAFQLKSNNLIVPDSVMIRHILRARPGRGGKITDHRADFENFGIPLGDNINEQNKNLRGILAKAFDDRFGIARIGEGFGQGIRTVQYEGSLDPYVTVLGRYRGKIIHMVFETTSQGNELRTAFPISSKAAGEIELHSTFLNLDNVRYRESRGIARSQAKAGAENPNEAIVGSAGKRTVEPVKPNLIDHTTKVQGTYGKEQAERKRGMLKNTVFSEGDAQEYNGRAEEAFKRDQIVGPEAIRGDFLAWAKSIKELANEHLFQARFPEQYKDGADRERDQQRLQSHRVIDQLIAKLERQKGFNPMTLKPGFLDAVRKVSAESMMISFKELAREAVNVHDATGLDPEKGGFIPPSDNLDGPNAERDKAHKSNLDHHWSKVKSYQEQFIKHVRLSMDTGMLTKQTGLEVIDMANEIRSRSFSRADEYGNIRGWGRMSEGDAENMRIPGGARDEAMKRRPSRTNKTYLGIGHGEGYAGNPGERPAFDPEKVYLYHFDSDKGRFTVRNLWDIADAEGLDPHGLKPDDFVHGDQGGLGIDSGVGLKARESGLNGRIEVDDQRKTILISAGASRGSLNDFSKGKALDQLRSEALSQVRSYVENMQKKGTLPSGYKVEGYDFNMGVNGRFSEGDAQETRSFREPNHKDESLIKNGFITNYADDKFIRGARRDQTVLELRQEYGTKSKVFDPSVLKQGTYRLDITDKVTGREYGHITFSMESDDSAYVVSTLVRGVHENKGVAKVMYAELGERLRRAGVTELTGMVVDEYVDPKTGEVIHRPINAREAVFGLGSTEVDHRYEIDPHATEKELKNGTAGEKWMHADVRTKIDPARRLSEGDAQREDPAMPPDTNPRTKGGELANHTNAQLAKRGFISNYAESKLSSLAGMKVVIGLQLEGAKPPVPITDAGIDYNRTNNTFQGKIEYTGENGMVEVAQFTYVVENAWDKGARQGVPSETGAKLDWIKIKPQWRGRELSNVIVAEVVERLKRLRQDQVDLFVVDPEGRPISAINRILGEENVTTSFNGMEETDGRDQFRIQDPNSSTGFSRKTWDVTGEIDPKKLYSEGDDGENMRIPGGARDEALKRRPKAPKPIKFWTDVGHADRRDAEGEQNTYLWYATKDGEIDVISADELRGLTQIESDDIPTHHDWESHIEYGNIEGKHGKQPITSLPHGRIDDRGDVTRVSYMDHKNIGRTDYEFLRDEIKNKLAGFMLKQADDMPGYDFTKTAERGSAPERFSEGDSENMRIPGGARDEALKKRELALRQKRFRKADIGILYTDIGHPEGFGPSAKMDMAEGTENQFLWSYDRYGQFHMQSVREAVDTYNEQRLKKYNKLIAEGSSEESVGWLKHPINEDEFTHNEWAKSLGLSSALELDYKTGNGRLDITADGQVRMSWVAKIKEVRERQMMAEQIKEEAASWLNSNKGSIRVPVTSKVKMPFRGTTPEGIVGWNWGEGSDDRTGTPRRFSEGDAENGRWENQERAKGKIPNAKVSNGETDLGFVLDPGEELDSKGLRIRKNTAGNMFWGSIGHDPDFFMESKEVVDALGKTLPNNFDAAAGLFAYDSSTGRVMTTQDRLFETHIAWLDPKNDSYKDFEDPGFGRIPANYSMMGRFEPAIIGTDGVVIRRGRISLARNVAGGNWVFDTADFSRSDIPAGAMAKIREAVAEEANAILDGKNRAKFEPAQDTAADHYDVFGFGMAKEKEAMGFSPKDTGPIKLNEDAKTYRDLADRPIGEGKDGQARLLKIGRQFSEGDAVEETPFRIPKTAGNRTNMQLAKDIATARFFTGISTKAHENAAEFPLSKTMKEIANLIHARAGAEAGVTGLDLPTAIMKERTKQMNRFFDIMDPLRSEFAAMDRDGREQAYQELADMVTGLRPIDSSTSAGRAAEGIKAMLKEMHDYRTAAGEKLGEVEDYFPAVYDSINISENAMAFKEDAKRAYMIELGDTLQGDALEAAAEKAARELTMSHIRGEGEGTFNDLFESEAPAMGENSSMKRKFGPESQRIMSKWQIKDPYRIISRYIAGATKRAELTRRLGDEGQQWRRMAQALEKEGVSYEKIDEMRDLLKASVGVGLRQNTRGEQTFIDLMGLYTAGSVMGRSFLNNMFEPASMGIRSGNLALGLQAYGETWGRTIRNAARVLSGERIDKTFWEQYAEHVGTISADINDAWMNSHSIEVDGDRSDPRINWLTSKVYQSNLLQITENAKLQASHAIGFKYLVSLGEMHQGKSFMNRFDVAESVRSNLRELGIPDADHAQFAQWMTRLNSLDDAGRMRMLTSGGKMSKMFETAITKFSMQSSVRPSRAHKPVYQDGPIGKTLFQLMSYSYSYAAEINSRTYDYAKSALKSAPAGKSYTIGDRVRFMAPLLMVPLGIIAFRAMFALKDELYPTEYSEKHKNDPEWTKWLNATSFAGAFGPKVEMATKYVMRDQPPGGPLGQAVVGGARAAKTAVTNAIEGKPQDNAIRQAKKASVSPIKAAVTIGATAVHPAAGTIASQVANSTSWSNAMTEADKKETDKKKDNGYTPYQPKKQK